MTRLSWNTQKPLSGSSEKIMIDELQKEIAAETGVNTSLLGFEAVLRDIDRRVAFIKKAVSSAKASSLVLGVSGGVDSTVAGQLCQMAANQLQDEGYDCRLFAMRLPYGEQFDEADAQMAIKYINPDEVIKVNIAPAVDAMMLSVPLGDQTQEQMDFVKGNVKARMRMIAQYAQANLCNGLVVGTCNAAEDVMGFATKYGDNACDIAPLHGLTKNQVRRIASDLDAPMELVQKTPTGDLEDGSPGKPDEAYFGMSYDTIDGFLLGESVSSEDKKIIVDRYFASQHKRKTPRVP